MIPTFFKTDTSNSALFKKKVPLENGTSPYLKPTKQPPDCSIVVPRSLPIVFVFNSGGSVMPQFISKRAIFYRARRATHVFIYS